MRTEELVQKPSRMSGFGEQQRMLHDLADRYHLVLRQRILGTDHQHQLVTKNWLDLQTGGLDRQRENAHLHRSVLEFLYDLVAEVPVDTDLHRRVATAIFGKHLRQDVQASGFVRSYA